MHAPAGNFYYNQKYPCRLWQLDVALTPKERVRRALQHEPIDRLPTQINYTRAMGEKLAAHFGISLTELPARLDNHLLRVDLTYPQNLSEDGRTRYDWWGVGWDTHEEGYWPALSPLAEAASLEGFCWPNPHDPQLLDDAIQICPWRTMSKKNTTLQRVSKQTCIRCRPPPAQGR